ncbi:MAG: protein kinase [Planctomycetes bacterium]|nr:protein kinase [Planctomycetota bacterium]
MALHMDLLVGRIALERGLVTRDQLADCLQEQAAQPPAGAPPLGQILLRRGFIRQPDLDSLLDEQKRRLAEAMEFTDAKLEDAILGRLLVRQGLATEKHVYECLRIQAEMGEQGQSPPRLGELLLRKGYLSADAVATALNLHPRVHFSCLACGARFSTLTYEPLQRYTCKKCGAPLVREDKPSEEEPLPVSHGPMPADVVAAAKDPSRRYAGGKYILVTEVGRGGMGVVWKAWQCDLERYVAIKQMSEGLLGESELRRFFREAQTAASLAHPNIATIYEAGTHEGKHYIAMEFVDGEPLSAYSFGPAQTGRHPSGRPSRQLPLPLALQIVREAALAVDYAHSKGVVHRDIKPHNIMLARSGGRVYVMDFGLAKPVKTKDGISMGDTIVGTPSYIAPEQARGETVDRRADVYSLGALLYWVLTGHPPFTGHAAAEILMKVLSDEPKPPRQVNPAVHPDLEIIALKCLEKDKFRRYDSAKSLAEDLTSALEGRPVRARPLSAAQRTLRAMRHHPHLVTTLTIGALTIALVVLIVRLASRRDAADIESYVHQGAMLARAGEFQDALIQYEKALALDGRHPEALAGKRECGQALRSSAAQAKEWRALADALFQKGEVAAALRLYEHLGDSDLRTRIRECEDALAREKSSAREIARQAEEALEREQDRRRRRARATLHYENARQIVDAAERLRSKPDPAEATRKLREALSLLERCLLEDPAYVEAQYLRGQIHLRLGDSAKAVEDFSAALAQEPSFAPAAFGIAMAHLNRYVLLTNAPYLPMRDESLAALDELGRAAETAARVSSDPFERWAAKALQHLRARNFAEASNALGRIASEGRGKPAYTFILAALRVEERERKEAVRELTALLELDPTCVEALYLRSILNAREGDPRTARADAQRFAALAPAHPYAHLSRALAHEMGGSPVLAAQDLEEAARLDPSLAPALQPEIRRLRTP